jgi:hypothetical protein
LNELFYFLPESRRFFVSSYSGSSVAVCFFIWLASGAAFPGLVVIDGFWSGFVFIWFFSVLLLEEV